MDGIRLLNRNTDSNPPYGGRLTDLMVTPGRAQELKAASRDFPSLDLAPRELCDLELLITGAFSPLSGFMNRADYEWVCASQRLADGTLWPVPVTLGAPLNLAMKLAPGAQVALRDTEGTMIAVLTVSEIWESDRRMEAACVYGDADGAHPEASQLLSRPPYACLAGRIEAVELPTHHDFIALRHAPEALRAEHERRGVTRVMGYQPRHLMHRTHVEFTRRAILKHNAKLLVLACVGRRTLEETGHHARVRALRAALEHYPRNHAQPNLVELSARRCGPRAALLHTIVAKNFGCTHFVVEHDYADTGARAGGEPLYGQYEAQEHAQEHAREIGVEIVPFQDLVYEEDHPEHFLMGRALARHGHATAKERQAQVPPERASEVARWFSYPNVLQELQKPFRGRTEQGVTIFFTGLSGSGKSTIAQVLIAKLMEFGDRPVTLLDGDAVRKHLSSELGFSREHRDINILRLGYVASLISLHRGITVCAPIAPYAATRAKVRAMVEANGGFVEVHVATPIEVCEARDRKGLYARARAGIIKEFTGVSDPYEAPMQAEVVIDTSVVTAQAAADRIIGYLIKAGHIADPAHAPAYDADGAKPHPDAAFHAEAGREQRPPHEEHAARA